LNSTSPAWHLLIEASKLKPSKTLISALFKTKIVQEDLLSLAIVNGIVPVIYPVIKNHLTQNCNEAFSQYIKDIKKRNFFMSAKLLQVTYLLQGKGIIVMPIKGPLLAQHIYHDIALRPSSDLDILVQQDDLLTVAHELISLGYKSEKDISVFSHTYILTKFSDISFVHQDTGLIIELHWKLLKSASAELAQISNIFENSIDIDFQNTSLSSLPIEEEFLYLCVHAAKHRFERIEWMNDLDRHYELYHKQYDWDRLLNMAENEDYTIPYLLGLHILHKLYERDIPHPTSNQHMQTKTIKKLYNKVLTLHANNYILKEKARGIRWKELFFSMSLEGSLYKKLKLFKDQLFPLYIDDILSMQERSKSFYFLYYLKRIQRYLKL